MDLLKQEPPLDLDQNVWPIQASSPNPARFDVWHKQFGAAVLGLDVWDMPELMAGYALSLFLLEYPLCHQYWPRRSMEVHC